MKERPLTELRRPAHSSAVLRLAIRSLERNMLLARRRVYVYPGASAKNTLPPFALPAVAVRRVALRDLPSNTAAAALQARTALESRTSCALSSLVFPVAQPRSSFRSLRVEPLLLAHAGQTYTTPECLHFACTFGTLLRTVRLNLSTPMICCFARVATLLISHEYPANPTNGLRRGFRPLSSPDATAIVFVIHDDAAEATLRGESVKSFATLFRISRESCSSDAARATPMVPTSAQSS